MRFGGANESPSFKTAQLNDAHLFAVTRRHSVCTTVSSALLSSLVYVCSSVPYLRMSRTDAHLAAIFLPDYISILCNVLRHRHTYTRAHYLQTIDFLQRDGRITHRRALRQGWYARYRAAILSYPFSAEVNTVQCVLTIPRKLKTSFHREFISHLMGQK